MGIAESIIVAVSLCADCYAVSMCSSVSLREITSRKVAGIALTFAVIQAGLLLIGYLFGSLFVGMVEKAAHFIGFLLLLYVGASMLIGGIRGREEARNLNGFKNIVIGGIATSIDALAIGVAQSMTADGNGIIPLLVSVFAVTAISVAAGIMGGMALGKRYGRMAEIIGGCVLIIIGIGVLV